MGLFAPRKAETTLQCPNCGAFMNIERSCNEAYMACPKCKRVYPLADFIVNADESMEKFLENLYFDRI